LLFRACATQWRASPAGGLFGLDYSAVAVVAAARGEALTNDLLGKLQVMEGAALDEWAARAAAAKRGRKGS